MTFRIRYRAAHFLPHVYCALFVAPGPLPNQSSSICGTFTVRAGEEWEALQEACPGVEFVKEEE